jgi:TonB-linked SusC/RagA family outer membrane protein
MKRNRTKTFLILATGLVFALSASATDIRGRVVDKNSEPIIGAAVTVRSTSNGTVTGVNGEFAIHTDKPLPLSLHVTYVGYDAATIEVRQSGTQPDIVLTESDNLLNEVVVTALGISREKKSLGYATQNVSGETLAQTKETNLVNALTGKIAGVRTTNSQGDMGSARIVVRGETSIAGNNQPLFVIDGVPVDNSQLLPSTTGGGQSRDFKNSIADLNPGDIESVNVLKGPNAAALYGSRAAHGVILVTTKSGKSKQGLGVVANIGLTAAKIATLTDFQNVFGQGSNGEFSYVDGKGGGVNDADDESWGPKLDGQLIPQFDSPIVNGVRQATPFVAHPNNVRDFFETGLTQDYGVAISGSEDKYDFRLGANYQKQNGTVPNTEVKKSNFSLHADYKLTDRISVGGNANYIVTDAPNLPGGSYGQRAAGVMLQFLWFGRQVDIHSLKKDYAQNWNHSYYSNPYWRAYYNTTSQNRNRFIGDVHLAVKLADGLDFKFRSGTDFYDDTRKYKIKTGTNGTPDGSYMEDAYRLSESNTEALLNYDRRINDDLSVNVIGGFNLRDNQYSNNWQRASKLASPDLFTVANSKDPLESSNYSSRLRVYSGFASAQLGFRNWAYLNLTGRNDWSSTLPSDNRSYFYPSATASVILTEALDIKSDVLSFLKLRGGWAEVGNDAEPYQLATVYNIQTAFNGNPILTSSKTKNNPGIKPERTQSAELGLETAFLHNRIHLDVAVYNTNSIDQILKVQTSAASGYDYQLINAGKINNKGIEIQLGGTPVASGKFKWDVDLNYAVNRSKVIELDNDGLLQRYVIGNYGTQVVAAVGERYGALFGTAYKRDNQGNIIVDDNGRPKTAPDNKVLGYATPDWTGGLTNTFSYGDFTLSVLIDASIGGSLFSGSAQTGYYAGVYAGTLPGRDAEHGGITFTDAKGKTRDDGIIFDGVREDGSKNTSVLDAESYYKSLYSVNESWIYDASFIKLREIGFSYLIKKDFVKRAGLVGASLSLFARNLAFLHRNTTHIDPESAINTTNGSIGVETLALPTTRSFGFNLNLKF